MVGFFQLHQIRACAEGGNDSTERGPPSFSPLQVYLQLEDSQKAKIRAQQDQLLTLGRIVRKSGGVGERIALCRPAMTRQLREEFNVSLLNTL